MTDAHDAEPESSSGERESSGLANEVLRVGASLLSVYPRDNVGTATYVEGMLSALSRVPGIDPIVLQNAESAAISGLIPGLTVRPVPRFDTAVRKVGRVPALAAAMSFRLWLGDSVTQDLDVIHYVQSVPAPAVPREIAKVVTLHDVQHRDHPEFFSRSVRAWRRIAYDKSARDADVVITDSANARDRIVAQLGIPSARIHVALLGVHLEQFSPHRRETDLPTLDRLGVRKPYVFYPASLLPHKNHPRLFEALRLLEGVDLVLTGAQVEHRGVLDQALRDLGLVDRVHHLGLVPQEVLPVLYRHARALVFPSLYEGFGAPVVEAMASGCPVACSDRGSLPEVGGDAAIVFEADDPYSIAREVKRLLVETELRERCIERGLRRSRAFDWHLCAARHLEAYQAARAVADVRCSRSSVRRR
jgi:glycosyltransferase involved in cell wall biosynthesis